MSLSGFLDQVLSYMSQGGLLVMGSLVLAAILLWYGIGYRLMILRRGNRRSVRILVEKYKSGYGRQPGGIIDSAVVRGIEVQQKRLPYLRRRLDAEFGVFDEEIGRFAVVVRAVVISAPLLGLLGTVGGMIETFDSLGDMSLFSRSGGIAGGISQALFTTQMGLAVAIPGLLIGRVLDRRQRLLETELDKLKDILCSDNLGGTR
jgi:biopolymer transport protein ExbB